MRCEEGEISIPEYRLDQLKIAWRTYEELRLQQALAVLVGRLRVRNDAAADTHLRLAIFQNECSDRNIKGCRPIGRDMSDSAGVDSTLALLQFVNDPHGSNLGRASDRAAGKYCSEDFV